MAVVAAPSTVSVYPAATSNPTGNPTATVMLTGATSYTVANPAPTVVGASITGSVLTVTYVAPLMTAGTPITLTVTGSSGAGTATVTVYSYGAMMITGLSGGGVNGSFSIVEAGYAGSFAISSSNSAITVSPASGSGPVLGPVTLTATAAGSTIITVTDGHGSSMGFTGTAFSGATPVIRPSPLGYPSAGAWFDFQHMDADGLPTVGEIRGMACTGAAPLRGPYDYANFVWCSGAVDSVGTFDTGYGDFGANINVTLAGKADFFDEELQDVAPTWVKSIANVALILSIPQVLSGEQLTFTGIITADLYGALQSYGETASVALGIGTQAVVGSAVVGTAVLGVNSLANLYNIVRIFPQAGSQGHVLQFGATESSVFPWITLGYLLNVNANQETVP